VKKEGLPKFEGKTPRQGGPGRKGGKTMSVNRKKKRLVVMNDLQGRGSKGRILAGGDRKTNPDRESVTSGSAA